MKGSKSKKIIIAIILSVILIPNIFTLIRGMGRLDLSLKVSKYSEPFVEQAIEYVKTQTNAIERYGYYENVEFSCSKRFVKYYDDIEVSFTNSEEFESKTRVLEVYVNVSDRATCVVVFEGNSERKLEITRYFWE